MLFKEEKYYVVYGEVYPEDVLITGLETNWSEGYFLMKLVEILSDNLRSKNTSHFERLVEADEDKIKVLY